MSAAVVAVHRSASHTMAKGPVDTIRLVAGVGVEGDAHAGVDGEAPLACRQGPDAAEPATGPPHRDRDCTRSSPRSARLSRTGRWARTSRHGASISSRCRRGTRLQFGGSATVEVTGLRNPCRQLEGVRAGLQSAVLGRDDAGELVRRAGVMAVVLASGDVRPGDDVVIALPAPPHSRPRPGLSASPASLKRPSSGLATGEGETTESESLPLSVRPRAMVTPERHEQRARQGEGALQWT